MPPAQIRHRFEVFCATCDPLKPVAYAVSRDHNTLATLMLACHAQSPHTAGHELNGVVDGARVTWPWHAMEGAMFEVYIKCHHCGPGKAAKYPEATYKVSRAEYVPAVCLHWHSLHEGHPLECRVREGDGPWEQLHPPQTTE